MRYRSWKFLLMANAPRDGKRRILDSRIGTAFSSILRPVYDFIFPPVCAGCGALIPSGVSKVCDSCWSSLAPVEPDDPLFVRTSSSLTSEGSIHGLLSLYHFEREGTLQTLVHQLKYAGMTSLGVEFGKRLGAKLREHWSGEYPSGILAMPLHAAKRRERGYNQSEYVSRGISLVTGIPVMQGLVERQRYTVSQTNLNRPERKNNVSGAFVATTLAGKSIAGSTLLLVDDVVTTGATMVACGRVLVDSGASRIIAVSIALAE